MSDQEPEEIKYELVMPFVGVTSVGGPFDDEAFTAGWEMGALDQRMSTGSNEHIETTILTANKPQADLIAMKNGYRLEATDDDAGFWTHITATLSKGPVV